MGPGLHMVLPNASCAGQLPLSFGDQEGLGIRVLWNPAGLMSVPE